MSSQPIVQWNYIIQFYIQSCFLTTFLANVWKKVHNSKEVMNLPGLLVLTVGYIDIKTFALSKYYYITEREYFIFRLFILFVSTFSFLFFLYLVS